MLDILLNRHQVTPIAHASKRLTKYHNKYGHTWDNAILVLFQPLHCLKDYYALISSAYILTFHCLKDYYEVITLTWRGRGWLHGRRKSGRSGHGRQTRDGLRWRRGRGKAVCLVLRKALVNVLWFRISSTTSTRNRGRGLREGTTLKEESFSTGIYR